MRDKCYLQFDLLSPGFLYGHMTMIFPVCNLRIRTQVDIYGWLLFWVHLQWTMLVLIPIFSVCFVYVITEIPHFVYKFHNTKQIDKSLKMLDTFMIYHAENEVLNIK